MATADTISKWKRNEDTDTVFFGFDLSRDVVVQKVRDRVIRQECEFTDNEWSIKERPKDALFKDGNKPSTDDYKPEDKYPNRIPSGNRHFYAKKKGLASPDDVDQGQIGDCWFVSVLAGAAQVEGLVNSIAVEYNEDFGIYGFVFFKENHWIGTVVDDYLFYDSSEFTSLVFSKGKVATWVPLLEKAYAKIHYSYESLNRSYPELALTSLGGEVVPVVPHSWDWSVFLSINDGREIFTLVTLPAASGSPEEDVKTGLVHSHAYTILHAVDFHGNKLVKIRNPWGGTEWKLEWSDSDEKNWKPYETNGRINELGYNLGNDGTFFMKLGDLPNYFDYMNGHRYPLDVSRMPINKLISSWWNGQYSIFYTDRTCRPDFSTLELTFSTGQFPYNVVSGSGKDGLGTYIIEQGQHDRSSKAITFNKRYTNSNDNSVWHYQGQYSHKMYFGSWGTQNEPDLGKFIIRRVTKVKRASLTGKWRGYYFYNPNNGNDQMLMDLIVQENPAGGSTISGSGTDSVGKFTIQGQVLAGGSVNFTKQYVAANSWNYKGSMKGSEIWGTWGDTGGVFLMWKTK